MRKFKKVAFYEEKPGEGIELFFFVSNFRELVLETKVFIRHIRSMSPEKEVMSQLIKGFLLRPHCCC